MGEKFKQQNLTNIFNYLIANVLIVTSIATSIYKSFVVKVVIFIITFFFIITPITQQAKTKKKTFFLKKKEEEKHDFAWSNQVVLVWA